MSEQYYKKCLKASFFSFLGLFSICYLFFDKFCIMLKLNALQIGEKNKRKKDWKRERGRVIKKMKYFLFLRKKGDVCPGEKKKIKIRKKWKKKNILWTKLSLVNIYKDCNR